MFALRILTRYSVQIWLFTTRGHKGLSGVISAIWCALIASVTGASLRGFEKFAPLSSIQGQKLPMVSLGRAGESIGVNISARVLLPGRVDVLVDVQADALAFRASEVGRKVSPNKGNSSATIWVRGFKAKYGMRPGRFYFQSSDDGLFVFQRIDE